MIAFDADILTLILRGDPKTIARLAQVPPHEHSVPIVVAEEIMRGRLDAIRKAQGARVDSSLEKTFRLFERSLHDLAHLKLLSYTLTANSIVATWRSRKIRVGSNDLRIASICVAHSVKLISRNRRDFAMIPGLDIEFWD